MEAAKVFRFFQGENAVAIKNAEDAFAAGKQQQLKGLICGGRIEFGGLQSAKRLMQSSRNAQNRYLGLLLSEKYARPRRQNARPGIAKMLYLAPRSALSHGVFAHLKLYLSWFGSLR